MECKKKYYAENRDTILEYHKKYQKETKEHIKEYLKKYCEENKEQMKIQKRQYMEQNKEKYNIEIKCCCGIIYKGCNPKKTHERTKKHQAWINNEKMTAETI